MKTQFITLLLLIHIVSAEQFMTSGYEPWEPYHTVDSAGVHSGFEYEIVKTVFDSLHTKLKFEYSTWENALKMLEFGRIDLLSGAGYTKERAAYAYYSVPYRYESFSLFIRRTPENNQQTDKELLGLFSSGKMTTTLTAGMFYGPVVDSILKTIAPKKNSTTVKNYLQNIPIFRAGRSNCFLMETMTGKIHFSKDEQTDLVRIVELPNGGPLHVMFSKNSVKKEFVDSYNATFTRLLKNGSLAPIYQKAGVKTPSPASIAHK